MKEKMNKTSKIMGIIWVAIGLFTIAAVKVIAPVCAGMVETTAGKQVPMKCHYTSVAFVMMAVLLLVIGIVSAVTKQKTACGIMVIVISVLMFLIPNADIGMGICANLEMACNTTVSFVKMSAAAGIVSGIVALVLDKKEK